MRFSLPVIAGLTLGLLPLASGVGQRPAADTTNRPPSVTLQSFSVIVRDYDHALRWYTDTLGFVVVRDQRFGATERFIMVAPSKSSATAVVLQHWKGGGGPGMTTTYEDRVGKEVNIVLRTGDVTASYETMRARGVVFHQPPRQQPWGGEALFRDLYGNSFVLVGPLHARR
jgi:catechol 2,3-dioxygenase-like lactoylglutathione lyase family enzyme